jgi:hypothetical protein
MSRIPADGITHIVVGEFNAFLVIDRCSPATSELRKPLIAKTYPGKVWQLWLQCPPTVHSIDAEKEKNEADRRLKEDLVHDGNGNERRLNSVQLRKMKRCGSDETPGTYPMEIANNLRNQDDMQTSQVAILGVR